MATRRYWLMKTEPETFSIDDLAARGREAWDGVRNYQARNNMRAMQLGDRGYFYHSNKGLEIVGIVEVCRTVRPDPSTDDPRWECVDIRAVADMPRPVSLAEIKENPKLADMALVTNSRLSVQPVTEEEWREINRMGGYAGD